MGGGRWGGEGWRKRSEEGSWVRDLDIGGSCGGAEGTMERGRQVRATLRRAGGWVEGRRRDR